MAKFPQKIIVEVDVEPMPKGGKNEGVDGISIKDSRVVDGVVVSYEFLKTIFDYIERMEERMDLEFGHSREAHELISAKEMPFIHRVVGELLSTRYDVNY